MSFTNLNYNKMDSCNLISPIIINPNKKSLSGNEKFGLVSPLIIKSKNTVTDEKSICHSTAVSKNDFVFPLAKAKDININLFKEKIMDEKMDDLDSESENEEYVKGSWTKSEDELLINLINNYGAKNWARIARFFPTRIGKQCRERWHNHLNPKIKKSKWTQEEDIILLKMHKL